MPSCSDVPADLQTSAVHDVEAIQIAVGDLVAVGGSWYQVTRVNAKSVNVDVQRGIQNRLPKVKMTAHRPARLFTQQTEALN